MLRPLRLVRQRQLRTAHLWFLKEDAFGGASDFKTLPTHPLDGSLPTGHNFRSGVSLMRNPTDNLSPSPSSSSSSLHTHTHTRQSSPDITHAPLPFDYLFILSFYFLDSLSLSAGRSWLFFITPDVVSYCLSLYYYYVFDILPVVANIGSYYFGLVVSSPFSACSLDFINGFSWSSKCWMAV